MNDENICDDNSNDMGLINEEGLMNALAEMRADYDPNSELPSNAKPEPGETKVPFGKWKGTKVKNVDVSYVKWAVENFEKPYQPFIDFLKELDE